MPFSIRTFARQKGTAAVPLLAFSLDRIQAEVTKPRTEQGDA